MGENASKKKSSAKSAAKKSSAPRKRAAAKKSSAKKSGTGRSRKSPSKARKPDTLHNVARSIGSTLGTMAKKATDAVKAAKDVLPEALKHSDSHDE